MVDRERVAARLERLDGLLARLEQTEREGLDAYLLDEQRRLATERALSLALQIVVDLGAQLTTELRARTPDSYADVFVSLAEAGRLEPSLAHRLSAAARQRTCSCISTSRSTISASSPPSRASMTCAGSPASSATLPGHEPPPLALLPVPSQVTRIEP